jgi:tetratricopeptide (TPR) repeat protein
VVGLVCGAAITYGFIVYSDRREEATMLAQLADADTQLAGKLYGETLKAFKAVAEKTNPNSRPQIWHHANKGAGLCHFELAPAGDTENNLLESVRLFGNALRVSSISASDRGYALTHLGNSYASLSDVRSREENLSKSLENHGQALELFNAAGATNEIGMAYLNLGMVLSKLASLGQAEERLAKAVELQTTAREHFAKIGDKRSYAASTDNMASDFVTMSTLPGVDTKASLEKAISLHKDALAIRTIEFDPVGHATTIFNLAKATAMLGTFGDVEKRFDEALAMLENARDLFAEKNLTRLRNLALINLGFNHEIVSKFEGRSEHLAKSGECCREALRFFVRSVEPLEHARAQRCLGTYFARLAELEDCEINLSDLASWRLCVRDAYLCLDRVLLHPPVTPFPAGCFADRQKPVLGPFKAP